MKEGTFFQIPESPQDVESLRRHALPLEPATRPAWLDAQDDDYYRFVGCKKPGALNGDERAIFQSEVEELRAAGLVVEQNSSDPATWRIYVQAVSDYDDWSIGIYAGASPLDLRPAAGVTNPVLTRDDVSDVTAVFVADPFLMRHGRNWFMFFEILNWRANKGEIGLATSEDGFRWQYQQRVLVEPFHLSYPYVFEHGGQHYMIPEARQSGEVRLYRAAEFPARWSCVATLLSAENLVDMSIFVSGGKWWMFAGDATSGKNETLRLYSAASLTGPWQEHPASPVIRSDAHSARPGGRVLVDGERLIRFAQNCHGRYGLDVRAFEITQLTPAAYAEKELKPTPVISPCGLRWASGGMHHVDAWQLENGSWLASVDGWPKAG